MSTMLSIIALKRTFIECGSLARLGFECLGDYFKMLLYCKASPFVSKKRKQSYDTIILTHTIEKGLALPSPRPFFGEVKLSEIMANTKKGGQSTDLFSVTMAAGALKAYAEFHQSQRIDAPFVDKVRAFANDLEARGDVIPNGGTRPLGDVFARIAARQLTYVEFLRSRSSVRCFKNEQISDELLRAIVLTAQSSPSQCNRQASRVHCYQDRTKIQHLLALQGGASGFADQVFNLFIVTNEMHAWSGARERNQAFIDGSLFAMCLMYACHSMGIAACPLNLAVTNSREAKIHAVGSIPKAERAIMMIAFGYPSTADVLVAKSPRLTTGQVLRVHN